jgi:hypothetical protein
VKIKIGKIELGDWQYQHHHKGKSYEWYFWYRNTGLKDDTAAAIHSSVKDIGWRIYFGGELGILRSLCQDTIIIVSENEAQEYVDKFLIRMNNLIIFA